VSISGAVVSRLFRACRPDRKWSGLFIFHTFQPSRAHRAGTIYLYVYTVLLAGVRKGATAAEKERSEHERTCSHATQQFRLVAYLLTVHAFDLFESAPPVDVDKVAKLLGIQVSETPNARQSDTVGNITLREGRPAEVWINPLEDSYVPRRRFTHEIGHFCMHGSTDRHEFIDDKKHDESQRIVLEPLRIGGEPVCGHPADAKRTTRDHRAQDHRHLQGGAWRSEDALARFVNSMAARFGVSSPAMEYRLKSLGVGKRG
jgi:hypothetical protein